MTKLRNILLGAGVTAVGAIGTKKAVDYLRNRGKNGEKIASGQGETDGADEVDFVLA